MKTLPLTQVAPPYADDVFTGISSAIKRLRLQVARLAPHFHIALLTGEPGSGKFSVAREMHRASPAAGRAFTVVSSADFAQVGQFSNESGTIYIPDIESLPPSAQGRLLRAIRALSREIRVVVASQCDMKGLVSAGRMRHDLFDTVGDLEIRVAPLRERTEDLKLIMRGMMERLASEAGFSSEAMPNLEQHTWPGNLEELFEACQGLALGQSINLSQPNQIQAEISTHARLEEVLQRHVKDVLQSCAGNKLRAAEALGISRSTLYRMLDSQPHLTS